MDRGTWWAIVHGVTKESDMTWRLNNNNTLIYTTNSTHQHFISNFAHPMESSPPPLHFPSVTIHLTSFPLSPFLLHLPVLSTCSFFVWFVHLFCVFMYLFIGFFLVHTWVKSHGLCLSHWLISLSTMPSRPTRVVANTKFHVSWLSSIPFYIYSASSLSQK